MCIVISHPHFYTTHVEWARVFGCPVYTAAEDAAWLQRAAPAGRERRLIRGATEAVLPGVTAIKTGGHFDGSPVLHWERALFIADSFLTVQVSRAAPRVAFRKTRAIEARWSFTRALGWSGALVQWSLIADVPAAESSRGTTNTIVRPT